MLPAGAAPSPLIPVGFARAARQARARVTDMLLLARPSNESSIAFIICLVERPTS